MKWPLDRLGDDHYARVAALLEYTIKTLDLIRSYMRSSSWMVNQSITSQMPLPITRYLKLIRMN